MSDAATLSTYRTTFVVPGFVAAENADQVGTPVTIRLDGAVERTGIVEAVADGEITIAFFEQFEWTP